MHTSSVKLSEVPPTTKRQPHHGDFCSLWTAVSTFQQAPEIFEPALQSELTSFTSLLNHLLLFLY